MKTLLRAVTRAKLRACWRHHVIDRFFALREWLTEGTEHAQRQRRPFLDILLLESRLVPAVTDIQAVSGNIFIDDFSNNPHSQRLGNVSWTGSPTPPTVNIDWGDGGTSTATFSNFNFVGGVYSAFINGFHDYDVIQPYTFTLSSAPLSDDETLDVIEGQYIFHEDTIVNEADGFAIVTISLDLIASQGVPHTRDIIVHAETFDGFDDYDTTRFAESDESKDYTSWDGDVTIYAGTTYSLLAIPITDDQRVDREVSEYFRVVLTDPYQAAFSGNVESITKRVEIVDDDVTKIQFGRYLYSVIEPSTGTYTLPIDVQLTKESEIPVTVQYATDDRHPPFETKPAASADCDFVPIYPPLTLTFAPGEMVKTFDVLIESDNEWEPTEYFGLTLSNAQPNPRAILNIDPEERPRHKANVRIIDSEILDLLVGGVGDQVNAWYRLISALNYPGGWLFDFDDAIDPLEAILHLYHDAHVCADPATCGRQVAHSVTTSATPNLAPAQPHATHDELAAGGLNMKYSSATVDQPPVVTVRFGDGPGDPTPTSVDATLTFDGIEHTPVSFSTSGYVPGEEYVLSLQVDPSNPILTTGIYDWSVELTFNYSVGDPKSRAIDGKQAVVRRVGDDNPFGNGWGIDGYDRLYRFGASVVYVSAEGWARIFERSGATTYTSPDGEFGTLTHLGNDSFVYTTLQQTKKYFNSEGFLERVVDRHDLVVTYVHDSSNRLINILDPDGRVATLTYSGGQLRTIEQMGNRVMTFSYSSENVVSIQNPDGGLRTFVYDADSRLTVQKWGPETTTYTYDATTGLIESIDEGLGTKTTIVAAVEVWMSSPISQWNVTGATLIDPLSQRTTITFDTLGLFSVMQNPDGSTESWLRNSDGLMTSHTDGLDRTTFYQYATDTPDLTTITYADGTQESFAYDSEFHRVRLHVDTLGNRTTLTIDSGNGDVTAIQNALNQTTTLTWDAGRLVKVVDPLSRITTYHYDAFRRPDYIVNPNGDRTTITYDNAWNVWTVTDELGRVTTTLYDPMRRLTQLIDPTGATTTFAYNAPGWMTSSTDAMGRRTDYDYDVRGWTTKVTEAANTGLSRFSTIAYDLIGRPTGVTDPIGRVTQLGYNDVLRTNWVIDAASQRSTVTFDAAWQPSSSTDALSRTTEFVFDLLGRPIASFDPLGRATRAHFDSEDNLTRIRTPRELTANEPIVVNTAGGAGWQFNISTAMSPEGHSVVIWTDIRYGTNYDVFARVYDSAGRPVDAAFIASAYSTGDQYATSVAMAPDGRFVIGWYYNGDCYARVFDPDGTPVTGDIRVNNTVSGDQAAVKLAMDGQGRFIAAWTDDEYGSSPRVYYRRFLTDGTALNASDVLVDSTSLSNPNGFVSSIGADVWGNFIIGFGLYGSSVDSNWGGYLQRYSASGSALGAPFSASENTWWQQGVGSILMSPEGGFLVVIGSVGEDGSEGGVFARLFDAEGDPLDDEFQVNVHYSGNQKPGSAAMDGDGNYVISWLSYEQFTDDKWDAMVRRVAADGTMLTGELRVSPASEVDHAWVTVTVGADRDGDFMVTWTGWDQDGEGFGIMARRYSEYATTRFTYDELNRVRTITEAYGTPEERTTTLVYDSAGNVLSMTDARNTVTSFVYDSLDRLVRIFEAYGDSLQRTTTINYDSASQVLSVIEPFGTTTSYAYDAVGRVTRTIEGYGTGLAREAIMAYNALGFVTSTINPRGVTMTYDYDALNRPTAITEAAGSALARTTTMVYADLSNNVRAVIDALNRRTTFTVDNLDRVVQTQDALNGLSTVVFDAVGQVRAVADALNHRTTYSYDAVGRVTDIQNALGDFTTLSYDRADNLIGVLDANGHRTTMQHDALGRVTAVINALSETTNYRFDKLDNLVGLTNGRGEIGTLTYDVLNRLVAQTDSLSNTTTFSYDIGDNLTKITDALGKFTTFVYDALHRQISAQSPSGGIWTTVYDAHDNVTVSIDPLGQRTTTTYDLLDRATVVKDARNGLTTMVFDAVDNLVRVLDPVGNSTTFIYDALNRQIRSIDPRGETTTYIYDAASRLTDKIDRLGRTTEYDYDAVNQMIGQTWRRADTSVENLLTFTFDDVGNQIGAENNAGDYVLNYDDLDRVRSVTNPWGQTLTFTYDAAGNRTRVQDSFGGVTTSTYDDANRLTMRQFSDGSNHLRANFAYTARNQLDTISRYSDLAGTTLEGLTSYAYDDAGRMTLAKHRDGASSWFNTTTYSYDVADRMLAEIKNSTPTSYAYDATDQLTSDGTNTYTHDLAGNRNSGGYTTTTGNRMTSDGTWNFAYDDEGNLIQKTHILNGSYWTYEYSVANELLLAEHYTISDVMFESVEYVYDAWGNLIERTEHHDDGMSEPVDSITRFALDGWKVNQDFWGNSPSFVGLENFDAWAELDESNQLVTRRIYGDAIDQPLARLDSAGTAWYHQDVRGSVVALTDGNGTVQTQYTYDGFGNATVSGSTAFADEVRYTARFFDNLTGLQHNRARWYDPQTGRWISEDPMGFGAGDANLYRYAGNGQTNASDPSGMAKVIIRFHRRADSQGDYIIITEGPENLRDRPFFLRGRNAIAFLRFLTEGHDDEYEFQEIAFCPAEKQPAALQPFLPQRQPPFRPRTLTPDEERERENRLRGFWQIVGGLLGLGGSLGAASSGVGAGIGVGGAIVSWDLITNGFFMLVSGQDRDTITVRILVAQGAPRDLAEATSAGILIIAGAAGAVSPSDALLAELRRLGIKHTPSAVLRIGRDSQGRIVFLERGNSASGLQHIVSRHRADFARRGISEAQIPDVIIAAITRGKKIGQVGSRRNLRDIYEVDFCGKKQRIAVGVGSNGFVGTAHPAD